MFIFSSTDAGCVSISAFALLFCVPVRIMSSAVEINNFSITTRIKKYKSLIKKKKKKHNKVVFEGKDKLNTTAALSSKTLNDSCIIHIEFVSVNNVFREYNEIKKRKKNPETSVEYIV